MRGIGRKNYNYSCYFYLCDDTDRNDDCGRFAHRFPININGDFDAVFSSFVFEHAVFDQIAFVQNRVFIGPGDHLARLQGGIGAKKAGGFDALKNLMAFLAQIFFFVGIA